MRGLEPDIQRLMARHQQETRRIEEAMRDEARREVAAEGARCEREVARVQQAASVEKEDALERERQLGARLSSEGSPPRATCRVVAGSGGRLWWQGDPTVTLCDQVIGTGGCCARAPRALRCP